MMVVVYVYLNMLFCSAKLRLLLLLCKSAAPFRRDIIIFRYVFFMCLFHT